MNLVELTEEFGSDEPLPYRPRAIALAQSPVCPRCDSKATKIAKPLSIRL